MPEKKFVNLNKTERIAYIEAAQLTNKKKLAPAGADHVTKILTIITAMIACPVPAKAVITKYIQFLMVYPADLLDMASDHILKKHKWNNFPKLAEFIEPMEELYSLRLSEQKRLLKMHNLELGIINQQPTFRGFQHISSSLKGKNNGNT
jgi:hypothetical protein